MFLCIASKPFPDVAPWNTPSAPAAPSAWIGLRVWLFQSTLLVSSIPVTMGRVTDPFNFFCFLWNCLTPVAKVVCSFVPSVYNCSNLILSCLLDAKVEG